MKRKFWLILLALVSAICLCFGLAACGEEEQPPVSDNNTQTEQGSSNGGGNETQPGGEMQPGGSEGGGGETQPGGEGQALVSFKTLQVSDDGAFYGKVSNATETFSFADEITAAEGAAYSVYTDFSHLREVENKIAPLTVGDNTFYVFALRGNNFKIYMVTLRRRPIYTVNFVTDDGTVASQQVEEDSMIAEPATTPEKRGYTFTHWIAGGGEGATFPCKAEENERDMISFYAEWQIVPEMENFDFTSTATTCYIKGVKDASVTEIFIPAYVTSINVTLYETDSTTITYCSELESIAVAQENANYSSQDGILYNKAKTELIAAPRAISGAVTIPDSVVEIRYDAFLTRDKLESVIIPDGVTSIGDSAFANCSVLQSVTIGSNVTSIGGRAFYNCSGLTGVYITDLATWCKIDFVDALSNPLCYAHHLYLDGGEVKNLTIPAEITEIKPYVFYGCSGLQSVTIGSGVISIGSAFDGCNGLTGVYITDLAAWCRIDFEDSDANPLYYAKHLFLDGEEVKNPTIPATVTEIKHYAFYNCEGLESVTFSDESQLKWIGSYAFYGCSSLASIEMPASVTSIGWYAFEGCNSLTDVTFENTENWSAGDTPLASESLAKPNVAAVYLTRTYRYSDWKRKE